MNGTNPTVTGTALLSFGLACALATVSVKGQSLPNEPPLLREKGCHACHAVEETLLGPSYQAISLLHGARKDVMVEILAQKIIVGGGGTWGLVPMVPNETVTEEEAREMAVWILGLESG